MYRYLEATGHLDEHVRSLADALPDGAYELLWSQGLAAQAGREMGRDGGAIAPQRDRLGRRARHLCQQPVLAWPDRILALIQPGDQRFQRGFLGSLGRPGGHDVRREDGLA